MQIDFSKEIYNDTFFPLLYDQSRYLILKGGAGSGKSIFAAQKMLFRMLTEYENRFLFVRAVKDTIRNSMYKTFKDLVFRYKLQELFDFRETDLNILCPQTRSEIICIGMNDRERIKSIADPTGAWEEEPTELEEDDHNEINRRIRTDRGDYRQTIMTLNPILETHWIRQVYFPPELDDKLLKKKPVKWIKKVKMIEDGNEALIPIDITLHHSDYEDNKFINAQYKAELEEKKKRDINQWRVYAKGYWGIIGNLVFNPAWEVTEVIPSREASDEYYFGIDFGFIHPTVLMEIRVKEGIYYVLERLYEKKKTKPAIIEQIKEEHLMGDNWMNESLYCDSAEPDTIDLLVNEGFGAIPSIKGNNSVKDGIDHLKSLKIYSYTDNIHLNTELRSYKLKETKDGKPIEGMPHPYNDDCISATRYAIYTHSRTHDVKVAFVERDYEDYR